MSDGVVRIPQHRHCLRCGKAFVGDGRYCTGACMDAKEGELRASRRKLMTVWGVSALIVVAAIAFTLL